MVDQPGTPHVDHPAPWAADVAAVSRRSTADDAALVNWLGQRQRHAIPRLISVGVSVVVGLVLAQSLAPPWSLLSLYGGPLLVVVLSQPVVAWVWIRRGQAIGLDAATIREVRQHLRQLPPRVPLYSGEELLAWLEQRMPNLRRRE